MKFKTDLTPQALERFKSKHKANIYSTIVAMSVDKSEAMSQLKRRGYKLFYRNKIWEDYGKYVGMQDMLGVPWVRGRWYRFFNGVSSSIPVSTQTYTYEEGFDISISFYITGTSSLQTLFSDDSVTNFIRVNNISTNPTLAVKLSGVEIGKVIPEILPNTLIKINFRKPPSSNILYIDINEGEFITSMSNLNWVGDVSFSNIGVLEGAGQRVKGYLFDVDFGEGRPFYYIDEEYEPTLLVGDSRGSDDTFGVGFQDSDYTEVLP